MSRLQFADCLQNKSYLSFLCRKFEAELQKVVDLPPNLKFMLSTFLISTQHTPLYFCILVLLRTRKVSNRKTIRFKTFLMRGCTKTEHRPKFEIFQTLGNQLNKFLPAVPSNYIPRRGSLSSDTRDIGSAYV